MTNPWGLEARLGNPSPTRFQAKQAAKSQCVSHAAFFLPLILWRNRQIISHLVLRSKSRNCRGDFVGQITKPQLPILRHKPRNPSEWFWGQTTRTIATGFEAKSGETIDLGFQTKIWNSRSSSPCARCRPHTVSLDISIIRQPSIWPVLDHPWSKEAPQIQEPLFL
jgi:hypothetical protein